MPGSIRADSRQFVLKWSQREAEVNGWLSELEPSVVYGALDKRAKLVASFGSPRVMFSPYKIMKKSVSSSNTQMSTEGKRPASRSDGCW